MIELWRYLMANVFGVHYVVLVDHDGDRNVRPMFFMGGLPFAQRGWGVVRLLDGGDVQSGLSYVEAWEPYEVFAPRKYPIPPSSQTPPSPREG